MLKGNYDHPQKTPTAPPEQQTIEAEFEALSMLL